MYLACRIVALVAYCGYNRVFGMAIFVEVGQEPEQLGCCMFYFVKKLFLLLLLLAGLGFGSKLLLEYRLQQQLDEVIALVSSRAAVRYQSINIDIDGGVDIHGVSIEPSDATLGRTWIDLVRISGGGRGFVINAAFQSSADAIPNVLNVELQGADLGLLQSEFFASLVEDKNSEFRGKVEPRCGDKQYLAADAWSEMGYSKFIFDADVSYYYSSSSRSLELSIDAVVPTMFEGRIKVVLGNVSRLEPSMSMLSVLPSLKLLEIDYIDSGYIQRMTRYCADKMQMTLESYIEREVSRDDAYYIEALGVIPGLAVRRSYWQFLQQPQSINFATYPAKDFELKNLAHYPVQEWASAFKLSLLVNSKAVTPLEFSQTPSTTPLSVAEIEGRPVVVVLSEPEHQPQFIEVGKRDLDQYIGHKIRVYSVNGRMREGVFKGVRSGNIDMVSKKYGSKMGVSVSVFSSEKVEVYK